VAWEHSKALGLDFAAYEKAGKGVVVRHHELTYLGPTYEGDRVLCATWITGNDGRLRLRRRFQFVRQATGETCLRGLTDFVCISLTSGKPTRMPPEFVAAYALTAPEEAIG